MHPSDIITIVVVVYYGLKFCKQIVFDNQMHPSGLMIVFDKIDFTIRQQNDCIIHHFQNALIAYFSNDTQIYYERPAGINDSDWIRFCSDCMRLAERKRKRKLSHI
jgi:hypothetical protein